MMHEHLDNLREVACKPETTAQALAQAVQRCAESGANSPQIIGALLASAHIWKVIP